MWRLLYLENRNLLLLLWFHEIYLMLIAHSVSYYQDVLTNRNRSFQNTIAVETGLSDHHKMVITVLKTTFKKAPPKLILYRNYKNFLQDHFRRELETLYNSSVVYNMSNDNFMVELMKIVDKYAPIKQKYIRLNQGPFITKKIRKETMKRLRLRNIYLRDSSPVAKQAYNKQRNL